MRARRRSSGREARDLARDLRRHRDAICERWRRAIADDPRLAPSTRGPAPAVALPALVDRLADRLERGAPGRPLPDPCGPIGAPSIARAVLESAHLRAVLAEALPGRRAASHARRGRVVGRLVGRALDLARDLALDLALDASVAEVAAELEAGIAAGLAAERDRFRAFAAASSEVLWEWDVASGALRWDGALRDVLGYAPPPAVTSLRWREERVHPVDRERACRDLERAVAGGADRWAGEYRFRRADGRYADVADRVVIARGEGRAPSVFGAMRDLGERRRLELALRESRDRYAHALEAADTGTWTIDLCTRTAIRDAALSRLLGLPPVDAREPLEALLAHVHPDDRRRVVRALDRALRSGAHYEHELRVVQQGGSVRWLRLRGRCLEPRGGPRRVLTGAATDVTGAKAWAEERERLLASERAARDRAERASRGKDELLATISHELRTPLQAILGWARLAQEGADDGEAVPPRLRHVLEVIERNARVQVQLIDDLLDLARVHSGKLTLARSELDLRAIVRAAVDTALPSAEARGVRVEVRLPARALTARVDADRLQQAIWNLLSNAVKFTSRGGSVVVELDGGPEEARIVVSDTGQGIAPEDLASVFDRLWQSNAGEARRQGGLGLGLALVRQIVELHGGRVRAESDGVGRGARFEIRLPGEAEARAMEQAAQ